MFDTTAEEFSRALDRIHAGGELDLYFAAWPDHLWRGVPAECLTCDRRFARREHPRLLVLVMSPTAQTGFAGICRGCAETATWPQAGWRRRLLAAVKPVFETVFGDLSLSSGENS